MKKVISIMIVNIFLIISAKCLLAELSKSIEVGIIPDIEFDTSIVNTKNLDEDYYGKFLKCVSLNTDNSRKKDLTEYLKGTLSDPLKNILRWSIKSSHSGSDNWQETSELTYGSPSIGTMIGYYVSVKIKDSSEISDRLIVVVVNSETATNFSNWFSQEEGDTAWLEELPALYSNFLAELSDPEPEDCTNQKWEEPKSKNTLFHPGASYEMRSLETENSHGHQACYNSTRNLITSGLGAGTADRCHWSNMIALQGCTHANSDVTPFIWAAQLDGNPINQYGTTLTSPMLRQGQHLNQYFLVRPIIANDKTNLNPDDCARE